MIYNYLNLGSMNSNEEHEADLLDVQDYSL